MKTTILSSLLLTAALPVLAQAPVVVSGKMNNTGPMYVQGEMSVNASTPTSGTGVILNNGTLTLSSRLILKSNDVTDGLLANKSTVVTSGMPSSNVQLHKTFSGTRYYYLSFPYPVNLSDIKSAAAGTPALVYGTDFYVRQYDGDTRARTGNPEQWIKVTSGSILQPGKGYLFALDAAVANREVIFPAADISNLFSTSDKAVNLAYYHYDGVGTTSKSWGWNFAGGLNTSNYDMSQSSTSNYSRTLYYFDRTINNYQEIKFSLGDQAVISPYTPFFTHESASGKSVVFNVNGTSISPVVFDVGGDLIDPVNLRSASENEYDIISLHLSTGKYMDRVRIVSGDKLKEQIDYNEDAAKMFAPDDSPSPQFWAMKDQDEMCITMLPKTSCRQVALGVRTPDSADYTVSMKDYANGYYQSVVLYDKESGTRTNLLRDTYTFSAGRLNSAERFTLELNRMPTSIEEIAGGDVVVYAANSRLHVRNIQQGDKVLVYDVTGRLLLSATARDTDFSAGLNPAAASLIVKVSGSVNKTVKIINR